MHVLVCDDHPIVAAAVSATITSCLGADVTIAHSFREARAALDQRGDIALCLIDLNMPGEDPRANLEALKALLPDRPIMVFSGSESDADLAMVVELGLAGFLPKSAPPAVIEAAVRLVMAGGRFLPDRVATLAFGESAARSDAAPAAVRVPAAAVGEPPADAPYGTLTDRQRLVLVHIAEGRSNKEIARVLGISPATVKVHVAHVIGVLGAANRTEAAARARRLGLV